MLNKDEVEEKNTAMPKEGETWRNDRAGEGSVSLKKQQDFTITAMAYEGHDLEE